MSKKQKVAIYPGSFDPIHSGHILVIKQAAEVFDKVVVLIAENPDKTYKVGAISRAILVKKFLEGYEWASNVKVDATTDSLVSYCEKKGISYVVRGLRNGVDLEYEKTQYEYNETLVKTLPNFNYVYFVTPQQAVHLSSTGIRQFMKYADVAQLKKLYLLAGVSRSDDKVFEDLIHLYKE